MKVNCICEYLDSIEVDYKFSGDLSFEIDDFSALNEYTQKTITWIRGDGEKYKDLVVDCAITNRNCSVNVINQITCDDPKEVFFLIMDHFFSSNKSYAQIESELICNAQIGKNVTVGLGSVLDGDITIGDGTEIGYNVKIIGNVEIGTNCIIKSGVTIGESDIDFYYSAEGNRHLNKQYGGVKIGNNVIIGPNSVINRGALGNTTVEDNVIIDALCNISHNVHIGKNTAIITGTNIFGSVDIGNMCYVSTSVIKNQVTVGDNVMIGMGSIVVSDIPNNVVVYGNPARVIKER